MEPHVVGSGEREKRSDSDAFPWSDKDPKLVKLVKGEKRFMYWGRTLLAGWALGGIKLVREFAVKVLGLYRRWAYGAIAIHRDKVRNERAGGNAEPPFERAFSGNYLSLGFDLSGSGRASLGLTA